MLVSPRQTKVSQPRLFGLSGCVLSPYYSDGRALREKTMKAVITGIIGAGADLGAIIKAYDNTGTSVGIWQENFTLAYADSTLQDYLTDILPQLASGLSSDTGLTFATTDFLWLDQILNPVISAPSSYQTIVSQSGTSAPAVSGSLTPVSSYASGTTFTWARTGTGVYTLTASTAVFNTSGKTSVFISPLTNLNAQVRGVVTSTTVITFTTAVGSVAALGLLGLTATNTDALLSNTMIYIQTYA